MAYTSPTNIAQFLQRSLTANESAALTAYVLAAVDAWINEKTGSNFADVEPSARYYDGGAHSLDIDPAQSITAVTALNDDGTDSYSYTENTEFILEPVNDTVKREIVNRGRGARFPRGQRRMKVTARFTEFDYVSNAVPADITLVATRIAAGILNAGKASNTGNLQRESLEGHSVQYDTTGTNLQTVSDSDPIVAGVLGSRRELFLYDNDEDDAGVPDYD